MLLKLFLAQLFACQLQKRRNTPLQKLPQAYRDPLNNN